MRPAGSRIVQTVDKICVLIILQVAHCILANTKGFAPTGATKGLSDRPLETFGPIRYEILASSGLEVSFFLQPYEKTCFFQQPERCAPQGAASFCNFYAPSGTKKKSTWRGVGVTSSSGMGEGVGDGSSVGCGVGTPLKGKISTACNQLLLSAYSLGRYA